MNIDYYYYLEKNNMDPHTLIIRVDRDVAVTPNPGEVKVDKQSFKHNTSVMADDLTRHSKRSRTRNQSPDHGTKRGSLRRHHFSPRDGGGRSIDGDENRSIREHKDNINKRGDLEERKGRVRDRERDRDNLRERQRDRDNLRKRERDKDSLREQDREKHRGSDCDRENYSGKDREPDWSHENRSQSKRHAYERVEEESKDREEHKERKHEKDYKERVRDIRPHKDRKEDVVEEVDPEQDQHIVFAYQIALEANERDVFEFFSQAGKVRDVRLIMDRISRRSTGVGYVEFVDAMSVPMAVALSGQNLLGQPVMVKPSEAGKNMVQPTSSADGVINGTIEPFSGRARRLYIGNLHPNVKNDLLRQVFEPFGAVEMVQLPIEPETGHCKGFGFVQFARLEDARAAESLNEQLEIAGHLIKVSAVSDQTLLETGASAVDFDDEGGGLALNGSSRALLMQKQDWSGTWLSGTSPLPRESLQGMTSAVPPFVNSLLQQTSISDLSVPPVIVPSFDLIGVPSECLLLKNMFDPKLETEPDFELDIKEDVKEECSKFGTLKHIYVDKVNAGFVYLRFEITQAAMSMQRALHGRWFAGKMITATFMVLQNYETKFPDSR